MNLEDLAKSEAYEEILNQLNAPFEVDTEVAKNQVTVFLEDFDVYQIKLLVNFLASMYPLRTSMYGSDYVLESELSNTYSRKSGSARSIARKFIARLIHDSHQLGMDLPELEGVNWNNDLIMVRFKLLNALTKAGNSPTNERGSLQERWRELSMKAIEEPQVFGLTMGLMLADSKLFDQNSKGAIHRDKATNSEINELIFLVRDSGATWFEANLFDHWIADFVFEGAKKLRELAGDFK